VVEDEWLIGQAQTYLAMMISPIAVLDTCAPLFIYLSSICVPLGFQGDDKHLEYEPPFRS